MSSRGNRLIPIYQGSAGRAWDRIERGQPRSYWEEHFVLGRRKVTRLLLSWMDPVAKRHFLDAGCGWGETARALAKLGSEVTAVDLLPRFLTEAASLPADASPDFVRGDFCEIFSPRAAAFDAVLLREVLEDYPHKERLQVLAWLGESPTAQVYLVFRIRGRAHWWRKHFLPEGLSETIDPVALLRWIHLHTPLRLARQKKIHLRTYGVQVAEFTRQEEAHPKE